MTLTGIQVDGSLTVTQVSLESIDDNKLDGTATFKEVTTSYPTGPPTRQAYTFYIQAEMDLNPYVRQGGPGAVVGSEEHGMEQAAYGLDQITLNHLGKDSLGNNVTFVESRELPVLDGQGVFTSAGTVVAAAEGAHNTASGEFTVTINFTIDHYGDITSVVSVGAGPAQGHTNPDDPYAAEVGYWQHSGTKGGTAISSGDLANPPVPAAPADDADDALGAAPATLTASQVQTGFQSVLTSIETLYNVNTIASWSMTVDKVNVANVNTISNYARSVQHSGSVNVGHPTHGGRKLFAKGEKLTVQNSVPYAVSVSPIGGGADVVLIPEHKDGSGIYAVLKQSAAGAASRTDVPGYAFTLKVADYNVNMTAGGDILTFTMNYDSGTVAWSDAKNGEQPEFDPQSSSARLTELYRVYQSNATVSRKPDDVTTVVNDVKVLIVFYRMNTADIAMEEHFDGAVVARMFHDKSALAGDHVGVAVDLTDGIDTDVVHISSGGATLGNVMTVNDSDDKTVTLGIPYDTVNQAGATSMTETQINAAASAS